MAQLTHSELRHYLFDSVDMPGTEARILIKAAKVSPPSGCQHGQLPGPGWPATSAY
jgi:hypothetical protein